MTTHGNVTTNDVIIYLKNRGLLEFNVYMLCPFACVTWYRYLLKECSVFKARSVVIWNDLIFRIVTDIWVNRLRLELSEINKAFFLLIRDTVLIVRIKRTRYNRTDDRFVDFYDTWKENLSYCQILSLKFFVIWFGQQESSVSDIRWSHCIARKDSDVQKFVNGSVQSHYSSYCYAESLNVVHFYGSEKIKQTHLLINLYLHC